MKKVEAVDVKQNIIKSVTCDKCKKETDIVGEWEEMWRMQWIAGYYSNVFDDGVEYAIDICEQCIKEAFGPYIRRLG